MKAAQWYQKRGFSVIPVRQNKKPYIKWEKYQSEKAGSGQIKTWWDKWPSANIGIVTGKVSGIDVVDCDSEKGRDALKEFLSDSLVVPISKTPRGWHYFFKHSPGLSNSVRVIADCDLRTTGGYVVVPPSKNEAGKAYAWMDGFSIAKVDLAAMPDMLFDILQAGAMQNPKNPSDFKQLQVGDFKQGDRDQALFHLANVLVKGGMSDENIRKYLHFFALHCDPPFSEKEALIKIESAKKRNPKNEAKIVKESIVMTKKFCEFRVSENEELLFPWLKGSSVNLISGWRGSGKTWFALGILDAVTSGKPFGAWECGKSVPCLYLDGEMVVQDLQERLKALKLHTDRENPLFVYSNDHASQKGSSRANLFSESWRNEMKSILIAKEIKLWVVDNLASLAGGVDENATKDWYPINQWLLELRFAGISTIMLHHTNKSGQQRGTSSREDNLDTSIILKQPADYLAEQGARFIINFTKARVQTSRLGLIGDTEFKLTLNENKDHVWVYGNVTAKLKDEVLQFLHEGLSQTEVAKTLGVNKATVSKIRNHAIQAGLLTPKNRLIPYIK